MFWWDVIGSMCNWEQTAPRQLGKPSLIQMIFMVNKVMMNWEMNHIDPLQEKFKYWYERERSKLIYQYWVSFVPLRLIGSAAR